MAKSPLIDLLQSDEGKALTQKAVDKGVAALHAAGLPSVGFIDGVVSMRWPDGSVVPVNDESKAELAEVQRRRAGEQIADGDAEYALAKDDWEALKERVRRGERLDAATLHTKLDAMNLAYARRNGLISTVPAPARRPKAR